MVFREISCPFWRNSAYASCQHPSKIRAPENALGVREGRRMQGFMEREDDATSARFRFHAERSDCGADCHGVLTAGSAPTC